jgi:type I restriction enzyme M protein
MSLLSSNSNIKSKIDDLWNKFWSGGISNPLTAIEQITYLLFMKKLDENDLESLANAEFTGDDFTSMFSGTFYQSKEDEEKQQNGIDKQKLRWS